MLAGLAVVLLLVGVAVVPGLVREDPKALVADVTVGQTDIRTRAETLTVSRSAGRTESTPQASESVLDDATMQRSYQRLNKVWKQEAKVAAAKKAARELKKARRLAAAKKSSTFRVGSFNILGSQHTKGSKRYESGPVRAGVTASLIASRGVDIVGMQEVQDDQLPPLLRGLSGHTVWPQHALGSNGQRLQIAWRNSKFELVETRNSSYTFSSQTIPLPYVRLRDRETKAEFWVMTVHNSAGSMESQRDAATAHQIGLIQGLVAETGKPLIVMGDVNEHEEFYQKVCAATGFAGANGGGGPSCAMPPRPLRVDWIMGGGGAGVSFSNYVQDAASLQRASDHYFIHANVSVTDPGERP